MSIRARLVTMCTVLSRTSLKGVLNRLEEYGVIQLTLTMLDCLAQAVLISALMYARMSVVPHSSTYIRVTSGGGGKT